MNVTPGIVLCAAVLLAACGEVDRQEAHLITFDTATVEVQTASDTFQLKVELADTEARHAYGLMDRDQLLPEAGMLFVYETMQDTAAAFWMFRTRIPLDIAFLDSTGAVVAIRQMDPCELLDPGFCPRYAPGARYQFALEVNRGFLQQRGITHGSRVTRVPRPQ